ncbi:MAG: hemerythrin domain-containing protein [Nitrososphaerota archaeon]
MKNALEVLKEEHELIKKGLDILEVFIKLSPDKILNSDVEELLDFFEQFADNCHHSKEEDLLFPLAEKRGIPKEGGPIGVMLFEHEEGRKLRKSILEALKRLNENFEIFKENTRSFVDLLRAHIDKEDNILYPMIDSVLENKDNEALLKEFEKIEEKLGRGIHEKYFKFIKTLAKKYNV